MTGNKLWDGFKILIEFLKKVGAIFVIPPKVYIFPYIIVGEYRFVEVISSLPLSGNGISASVEKNVTGRNGTVEKTKLKVMNDVAVNAHRGDGLWVYYVVIPAEVLEQMEKTGTCFVLTVCTSNCAQTRFAQSSVTLTSESLR